MTSQTSALKNYVIVGTTAAGIGALSIYAFRNRETLITNALSEKTQGMVKEKFTDFLIGQTLHTVLPLIVLKIGTPLMPILESYKIVFCQALDIPFDHGHNSMKLFSISPLTRSPVDIQRKELIDAILITLASSQTPSVLLSGSPGVGKSSLVKSLVGPLEDSRHPMLKGARIKPVSLEEVFKGELPDLFRQAKISNAIIYFDEFNTIFRNEHGQEQRRDILKTILEDKDARVIACTTVSPDAIDPAFLRRFTVIPVEEPKGDLLKNILMNSLPKFSEHHTCSYDETSIDYCIEQTQSLPGQQPAKAIRVLDQAGSAVWLSSQNVGERPEVTKAVIDQVIKVFQPVRAPDHAR